MPRNIQARRKLSDLYQRGLAVRFTPNGAQLGPFLDPIPTSEIETTVEMWVQPPNPLQRDQAMSEAQAARARAMLKVKRDQNSEEFLTSMNFLADMSDATLVDYLLMTGQEERKNEAIRDVLGEKEWEDFSVLQDAMRQFEEDETPEDDPEFAALLERDTEYGRQVNERFQSITEAAREMFHRQSRERLEEQGLEKRGMLVGSERFMEAYDLWMTYFSARDPEDHSELWYSSTKELRSDDDIIQQGIKEAMMVFIQDPAEAKNSPGATDGSSSYPLPSDPETSEPSTPASVSE